jgi:hypothetical protein
MALNLFSKAKLNPVAMGSTPAKRNDEWATPQPLFDWLNGIFEFTLDVFASDANHKCEYYFTKADNALQLAWLGRCFMNPPYSIVSECMDYAWTQRRAHIVALVPIATETNWWRTAFKRIKGSWEQMNVRFDVDHLGKEWTVLEGEHGEVWLSPYRIQFIDPVPPEPGEKPRSRNPKGSTIFVFYKDRDITKESTCPH